MTTTYTLSDLATRSLKDAGLIAAEETASASDLVWAQQTITEVAAELAAIGIRIWGGSEAAVPNGYLLALSARIGLSMSTSFGLMTYLEAEQAKPPIEMRLRALSATPPTGAVQTAEYF